MLRKQFRPLMAGCLVGLVLVTAQWRVAKADALPATQPRLIVWDGDEVAKGGGWVHVSKDPKNQTSFFKAQDREVHNGKKALELHAEVGEWAGGGWNWHSWTPKDAGDDVRGYQNLTFWVKYDCAIKPGALQVAISSSGDNQTSAHLDALKYCADALDGQWHEVVIPLKDLQTDSSLDPKKVWEINIGLWLGSAEKFSLYVDEIGFAGRAPATAP